LLDDRFLGELDDGHWPDVTSFDPCNDLHLDELAGRLLERFGHDQDAEAFALLIRLVRSRLLEIAVRVAARLPEGGSPEHLVEAVLGRLFNRPDRVPPACSFLVCARGLLEQEARHPHPRAA
jgi:hypothetical protein